MLLDMWHVAFKHDSLGSTGRRSTGGSAVEMGKIHSSPSETSMQRSRSRLHVMVPLPMMSTAAVGT